MIREVMTRDGSYPIYIESGVLEHVGEKIDLNRRCLVVTDDGVPKKYVECLLSQCAKPSLFCFPSGEGSKSLATFEKGLDMMLKEGFTRTDCVIALGGGVVGDLAGFIASAFMRGVAFYNIPTTLLSQVDSSIGGKVAVNFGGLKNLVGAFYPPKAVFCDPDTLKTLEPRQISAGLAESVKMAATFREEFFSFLEKNDPMEHLPYIIKESLAIKEMVVQEDEREKGLRKVLNFGHTLAHAIESESQKSRRPLLHGECVSLGMIPMTSPQVRERLVKLLAKLNLPTQYRFDLSAALEAIRHDKKAQGEFLSVIRVKKIGSFEMEKLPFSVFAEEVKGWIK